MEFITTKKSSRMEYRVYTEDPKEDNLDLIYHGHKLGIIDALLDEIINYKYELSSGKYYYIRYDVWKNKYNFDTPNNTMMDLWKHGNMTSKSKDLFDTWLILIQTLRSLNGDFKNIWVFRINI
jgi:hypothetical protein